MQQMKDAQLPKPAPASAPAPYTAPAAAPNTRWQETRTCHICKKVGHISPNCPERPKREKMVSKAVGMVLDYWDTLGITPNLMTADLASTAQPMVVGCSMPAYALQQQPDIRNTAA